MIEAIAEILETDLAQGLAGLAVFAVILMFIG